jgi:hypothetical protein
MCIMSNEVVLWFLTFFILFLCPPPHPPPFRPKRNLYEDNLRFNAFYFQIACVGRPTYLNLYIRPFKVSTVGMVINQMLA